MPIIPCAPTSTFNGLKNAIKHDVTDTIRMIYGPVTIDERFHAGAGTGTYGNQPEEGNLDHRAGGDGFTKHYIYKCIPTKGTGRFVNMNDFYYEHLPGTTQTSDDMNLHYSIDGGSVQTLRGVVDGLEEKTISIHDLSHGYSSSSLGYSFESDVSGYIYLDQNTPEDSGYRLIMPTSQTTVDDAIESLGSGFYTGDYLNVGWTHHTIQRKVDPYWSYSFSYINSYLPRYVYSTNSSTSMYNWYSYPRELSSHFPNTSTYPYLYIINDLGVTRLFYITISGQDINGVTNYKSFRVGDLIETTPTIPHPSGTGYIESESKFLGVIRGIRKYGSRLMLYIQSPSGAQIPQIYHPGYKESKDINKFHSSTKSVLAGYKCSDPTYTTQSDCTTGGGVWADGDTCSNSTYTTKDDCTTRGGVWGYQYSNDVIHGTVLSNFNVYRSNVTSSTNIVSEGEVVKNATGDVITHRAIVKFDVTHLVDYSSLNDTGFQYYEFPDFIIDFSGRTLIKNIHTDLSNLTALSFLHPQDLKIRHDTDNHGPLTGLSGDYANFIELKERTISAQWNISLTSQMIPSYAAYNRSPRIYLTDLTDADVIVTYSPMKYQSSFGGFLSVGSTEWTIVFDLFKPGQLVEIHGNNGGTWDLAGVYVVRFIVDNMRGTNYYNNTGSNPSFELAENSVRTPISPSGLTDIWNNDYNGKKRFHIGLRSLPVSLDNLTPPLDTDGTRNSTYSKLRMTHYYMGMDHYKVTDKAPAATSSAMIKTNSGTSCAFGKFQDGYSTKACFECPIGYQPFHGYAITNHNMMHTVLASFKSSTMTGIMELLGKNFEYTKPPYMSLGWTEQPAENEGGACIKCAYNTYGAGGVNYCTECDALFGTYGVYDHDFDPATQCIACPKGKYRTKFSGYQDGSKWEGDYCWRISSHIEMKCSDNLYTTQQDCEMNNASWVSVGLHSCSIPTHVTQDDCLANSGVWGLFSKYNFWYDEDPLDIPKDGNRPKIRIRSTPDQDVEDNFSYKSYVECAYGYKGTPNLNNISRNSEISWFNDMGRLTGNERVIMRKSKYEGLFVSPDMYRKVQVGDIVKIVHPDNGAHFAFRESATDGAFKSDAWGGGGFNTSLYEYRVLSKLSIASNTNPYSDSTYQPVYGGQTYYGVIHLYVSGDPDRENVVPLSQATTIDSTVAFQELLQEAFDVNPASGSYYEISQFIRIFPASIKSHLTAGISTTEMSIQVVNAAEFPTTINDNSVSVSNQGYIQIDNEIISYSGIVDNTITVFRRGVGTTTAEEHGVNSVVKYILGLSTLSMTLTETATEVLVEDVQAFTIVNGNFVSVSNPGYIQIDNEIISYSGINNDKLQVLSRGEGGTTAAQHNQNSDVKYIRYLPTGAFMNDDSCTYNPTDSSCSDSTYTTQSECTAQRGVWSNNVCSDPTYTTQSECTAPRGVWSVLCIDGYTKSDSSSAASAENCVVHCEAGRYGDELFVTVDSTIINLGIQLYNDVGGQEHEYAIECNNSTDLLKGDIIKINNEQMKILYKNNKLLHVRRGYNDSTISEHTTGSSIALIGREKMQCKPCPENHYKPTEGTGDCTQKHTDFDDDKVIINSDRTGLACAPGYNRQIVKNGNEYVLASFWTDENNTIPNTNVCNAPEHILEIEQSEYSYKLRMSDSVSQIQLVDSADTVIGEVISS